MSIEEVPGIQFMADTHRCYEYVFDFVVAAAALGAYFPVYGNRTVSTFAPFLQDGREMHQSMSMAGQASGKNLVIYPDEIFERMVKQDSRKGRIPFAASASYADTVGVSTGAIAETLEGFSQAMFTNYYENNLAAIEARFTAATKNWPAVLQFARLVRNSMSHGGQISITNSSAPPVTYFGLTYSHLNNGVKILHNDLTTADIFFLMLDVDMAI